MTSLSILMWGGRSPAIPEFWNSGVAPGVPRLQLSLSDISEFDLDARFDLIIAPFRVIQNLETDFSVRRALPMCCPTSLGQRALHPECVSPQPRTERDAQLLGFTSGRCVPTAKM